MHSALYSLETRNGLQIHTITCQKQIKYVEKKRRASYEWNQEEWLPGHVFQNVLHSQQPGARTSAHAGLTPTSSSCCLVHSRSPPGKMGGCLPSSFFLGLACTHGLPHAGKTPSVFPGIISELLLNLLGRINLTVSFFKLSSINSSPTPYISVPSPNSKAISFLPGI